MGEETTIMGTVLSVVFQNEENGYAVLRLVTDDGELLTLVGCVPCAAPGENLTATGSFSSHPQYGEQFSASEVERYLPSNETEILNYLASGVVRGVGPATAEKLVARFGIETLQVLGSEPEKLTAIKGMTARRAQEISAAFNEQMGLRRVMEFLAHYDLPAALSVPLYRRFGANAMAALERNPYLLLPARKGGNSGETAADNAEEGGDDVKSSCPLWLGLHTYYNGCKQREAKSRDGADLINALPVQIAGCNPPA